LGRTELLKSLQLQAEQRQGGANLRNNVQQGIDKDQGFLAKKKAKDAQKTKYK
jgi:hypothetical protein